MSLKAKLDGRDIVSVICYDADWALAQRASKGTEQRLKTVCCGQPACAKHSPLKLRYFAHKPGFDRCPSDGESEEHIHLKAATMLAVRSVPGWHADIEIPGDGWRADVLAVRESVKIAIEIQLSTQTKRETSERNNRFIVSKVTPFWLKGARNHSNDFGVGLQAPITGISRDEKISSVQATVNNLLLSVERQVLLANAFARLIRGISSWQYRLDKQGTIPVFFELTHENVCQVH